MAERNLDAGRMSSYALNARLASTTLRRLQAHGEGRPTLPIARRDVAHLRKLRHLLVTSLQGARLGLSMSSTRPTASGPPATVDEKLVSYGIVMKTLERPEELAAFVDRASAVLVKLERGRWETLEESDQSFAQEDLCSFLNRLARAGDFAEPARSAEQGPPYALA